MLAKSLKSSHDVTEKSCIQSARFQALAIDLMDFLAKSELQRCSGIKETSRDKAMYSPKLSNCEAKVELS